MSMPRVPRIERVCQHCGESFLAMPRAIRLGNARFCSRSCGLKGRAVPISERFWRYVGGPEENGCLLWRGAVHKRGYGIISAEGRRGRSVKASRVAWEIEHGPIPDGMCVCHHCDNPMCVNVEHLFLGTQPDNIADMVSKERQSRGEDHAKAKLTEEIVLEIRSRWASGEITQTQLAVEYDLTPSYVSQLVRGNYWKHLL